MKKPGRIFKKKKESNYTQVCNSILDDTRLSWQAKGLLCYLLRLPDNWTVYKAEVQTHSKNGREAFETAWKELEEVGHIVTGQQPTDKGKFGPKDYLVIEELTDAGNPQSPMRETHSLTDAGNPQLLILSNTNNTYNKKASPPIPLEERKKVFGLSLQPFEQEYGKQMLKEFYLYWTESDGKKMSFEIAKEKKRGIFQVSRRLITWKKNNEKFDRKQTPQQTLTPERASMPETYHALR